MRNLLLALISGVIAGEVLSVYLTRQLKHSSRRERIEDAIDDLLGPDEHGAYYSSRNPS